MFFQLYEIVTLVNELLPPMSDAQGNSVASSSNGGSASRGGRRNSGVTSGIKVEDSAQGGEAEISPRETLLRNQPDLLVQFGIDLFPVLVQVRSCTRLEPDTCASVCKIKILFSSELTYFPSLSRGDLARGSNLTLVCVFEI